MKEPEMKVLLDNLRIAKKKAQGLRYALEDSVAEAKAADGKMEEELSDALIRRQKEKNAAKWLITFLT